MPGGGEWSASCPGCFTARERVPSTHLIGGLVGPSAFPDTVEKRKKNHSPCWESNSSHPAYSSVCIL